MATLCNDKDGRRIQFFNHEGRRRTIHVGTLSARQAESFKVRVEEISAAKLSNSDLRDDTAIWLRDLSDKLHRKLVKVGLVQPRNVAPVVIRTIRQVVDEFHAKRLDVKASTKANWKQGHESLVEFFGPDRDFASITLGDADDWRQKQIANGYRDATIRKRTRMIKLLYRWAMRRGYVSSNPFVDMKSSSVEGKIKPYVTKADALKVMDKLPNHHWRLFFALGRFGGLRLPSEALALRWSDVHWDENKIRVRVPKLEHMADKAVREIPIFADLRPWLETAYEQAEPGESRVIVLPDVTHTMLRKTVRQAVDKAGVKPWLCVFHALRSSCEIDLAESFPVHIVAKWIGHSIRIAERHYLNANDAHFTLAVGDAIEKPAQIPAQCMHEGDGAGLNTTATATGEPAEIAVCGDIGAGCQDESGRCWTRTSDPPRVKGML